MKAIRHVKPGDMLALDASALRRSERGAFFWLFGPPVQENERVGDVCVVHVRGPMEHHDDGCGDSYDAIISRVEAAFADDEARAVVLCLDSPGGVVSGLSQTVETLKRCSAGSSKPLIAYVDEMATSAAYALCCACDEVIVPPSAITGSIGVISTMVDQTQKDADDGYRFVTITSGKRKADGHPHVAITDEAVAAESRRVEKLAMQFYRQVRSARGLPIKKIQAFQAGIFLGDEAVNAGLADDVMGWDQLIESLSVVAGSNPVDGAKPEKALAQTAEPESHSTRGSHSLKSRTNDMLRLDALIKKTSAALAAAKDDKSRAGLAASLEAYKKTKHSIEKHETEEGEEEEEEEADGNETDRGDDPEDDEDDDDKDKKDEDEEEEATAAPVKKSAKFKTKKSARYEDEEEATADEDEAEALAAAVRRATGKRGTAAAQGALEALVSKAKAHDALADRLTKLEHERADEKRSAVIQAALDGKRITRKEATSLRTKKMAYVQAFLEARPNSLVYSTTDDMPVPAMTLGGNAQLPADLQKVLDTAVAASGGTITREQFVADYAKKHTNGAP
jgi:signal peptide peptidase SppA